MRMSFTQTGRRYTDRFCRLLKFFDRTRSAIAQCITQTTNKLEDHICYRTTERYQTFNPLRNQLLVIINIALTVAFAARFAGLHRFQTAHPAVDDVAASLVQSNFTGTFRSSCQGRTHHD